MGLCLVPKERVDDELVKQALNWVFTNCCKEEEIQKVLGVLHWISGNLILFKKKTIILF